MTGHGFGFDMNQTHFSSPLDSYVACTGAYKVLQYAFSVASCFFGLPDDHVALVTLPSGKAIYVAAVLQFSRMESEWIDSNSGNWPPVYMRVCIAIYKCY